MGAAFTVAGIGIILSIFFGLGGVDLAFGAKDQAQRLFKRGTEETATTRRKSERDAENNTQIDTAVPKSRRVSRSRREENLSISDNIKDTARRTARQAADIAKLESRRNRKSSRIRAFKKSGAEVVRQKNIEEIRAKNLLRKQGKTFAGTGKFGREKLRGNPNFDLGLPSNATAADRARVIARKEKIAARRAKIKFRRQNVAVGTKKFQGKTKSELLAIAKSRGLKFNTSISASSLANVLLRTGGL